MEPRRREEQIAELAESIDLRHREIERMAAFVGDPEGDCRRTRLAAEGSTSAHAAPLQV
jgi:hypothetical protein